MDIFNMKKIDISFDYVDLLDLIRMAEHVISHSKMVVFRVKTQMTITCWAA